jgi:Zn-dependent protease
LEQALYFVPILLFSVVVHEYAHGYVANLWGDPTAAMLGRLTLNPLPHIDPVGSILVPAILLISQSPFLFGWARPVPVNPDNYRDRKWGDVVVSLAGPASNILLACLFTAVWILTRLALGPLGVDPVIEQILRLAVFLNLFLAFFNLLPIPPLDGSHILYNFLPQPLAYNYMSLARYGFLILMLFMLIPPLRQILGLVLIPVNLLGSLLVGLVQLAG